MGRKSQKKYIKNQNSAHSCHDIAVVVLRIQCPSQIWERLRKLLKQKQSHGTYHIAADGMTGGWSHDQLANKVKKETTKS